MKKALIYFLFLFVISCATIQKKEAPLTAAPQEQKNFLALQSRVIKNPNQQNVDRLLEFISKNPNSTLNDDASLLLGKVYFNRGQYLQAYNSYMNIIRSPYQSPLEAEAHLGAAQTLFKRGQFDETLSICDKGLSFNNISLKKSFFTLKEASFSALGKKKESIEVLSDLYMFETDPTQKRDFLNLILNRIKSQPSVFDLEYLGERTSAKEIQSAISLRKGELFLEQKNEEQAILSFEEVHKLAPHSEWSDIASGYLFQLKGKSQVNKNTVGVILPLSGKHEAVGRKVLQGLQFAFGIFNSNSSGINLAIIDSEAQSDSARRAVERLTQEDNVIAIVGDLLSKTSTSVATKSNEFGIPNITLSQKSDLTQIGDYVFRNAVTSQMQVEFLVQKAWDRGIRSFGILYPKDPYGKEFMDLFWNEVRKKGGQITAVQSYSPETTDFNEQIKKMTGTFYLKDRQKEYLKLLADWKIKNPLKKEPPPEELLPPKIGFQALFIPDNVKALGQIAPTLAFNNIKNITLIGTQLWNTDALIERGDRYIENALFTDILPAEGSPSSTRFYEEFEKTFDHKPSEFEVLGYDTGRLILQILKTGVHSRNEFKINLEQLEQFQGLAGSFIQKNREFIPPLVLFTVKDKKIIKAP